MLYYSGKMTSSIISIPMELSWVRKDIPDSSSFLPSGFQNGQNTPGRWHRVVEMGSLKNLWNRQCRAYATANKCTYLTVWSVRCHTETVWRAERSEELICGRSDGKGTVALAPVELPPSTPTTPRPQRQVETRDFYGSWHPVRSHLWVSTAAKVASLPLPRWRVGVEPHLGFKTLRDPVSSRNVIKLYSSVLTSLGPVILQPVAEWK